MLSWGYRMERVLARLGVERLSEDGSIDASVIEGDGDDKYIATVMALEKLLDRIEELEDSDHHN